MTARQEAADAIRDIHDEAYQLDDDAYYLAMVDAIPGDVHVRLAIERGALIEHDPLDGDIRYTRVTHYRAVTP